MTKIYVYVVARDFGFAPNPFHGVCTLATCKPKIRKVASVGDWVVGMGGAKLDAIGRCIYFMRVSGALSFNEYWNSVEFKCKRPVRNGSRKVIVGDNIYHRVNDTDPWIQEDSHHSKPDGTPELWNVTTDTSADRVLYSRRFVYFGASAPLIPQVILDDIGFKNGRHHRTFNSWQCESLLAWIERRSADQWNTVQSDPFQFGRNELRYSGEKDRLVT